MEKEKKTFDNEVILSDSRDYLNYVTITSTKEQRRKFDIGDIFINAAVCKKCGDYIRSKNRHDFVTCKCGNVSVDGGSWYSKRSSETLHYINVIEYFEDIEE